MHKTVNTTTGSMKKGLAKRAALLGLLSVMTVSSVMPAAAATTAGTGTAGGTTASAVSVSDQTVSVSTFASVGQVTGLSYTVKSDTEYKLTWNAVSGATGYEIYRKAAGSDKWVKVTTTTKTTHVAGSALTVGNTYSFRVRAYKTVSGTNSYGTYSTTSFGAYSNTITFTFNGDTSDSSSSSSSSSSSGSSSSGSSSSGSSKSSSSKSSTVTVKKVSGVKITYQMNNKQSSISWKKVSGAAGYEVYRQKAGSSKWTLAGTTAKTKYTDSGLSANETYRYKVRAYKKSGSAKVCGNYSSVKKIKAVYCTGASNLKAVNSNGKKAIISWNSSASNPETTTFTVYRKAKGSSNWTKIKETRSTKVNDTSAAKGIKYTYKVKTTIEGNGKTYTAKKSPTATVVLKTYSKQHYFGKVSVLGRSGNVYTLGKYASYTGYTGQDIVDAANSVLLEETVVDGTLLFEDHSNQVFRSLWYVKKGSTATIKTKYGTTKLKCVRVYYRNKNYAFFYKYNYADNEIVMSTCEVGGGSVNGNRVTVWKVTSGPSVKKLKAYYSKLKAKE